MTPDSKAWTPPSPSFLERVQSALLRASVASLVLSLALVLLVFLVGSVGSLSGSADALPDPRTVLPAGGLLATILFIVLAPALVLLGTRPMQDRAFTGLGFVATFFGLAMLVVFFFQLSLGVLVWFREMPRLIEEKNAKLLEAPKNLEKAKLTVAYQEMKDYLPKIEPDSDNTP